MNSTSKLWAPAAALSVLLALAAGCGDRGPTNLFSESLFGQKQAGPQLALYAVFQDSLSPGTGLNGFAVKIRNIGSGSSVGPIHATLIPTTAGCATPLTYGATVATAVFGSKGLVIAPDDRLWGSAVNGADVIQNNSYAFETNYNLTTCAGTQVDFTVTLSDARGGSWVDHFQAPVQ